jgi:hypothetical protein
MTAKATGVDEAGEPAMTPAHVSKTHVGVGSSIAPYPG